MRYDKKDHDRDVYELAGTALKAALPFLAIAFAVLGANAMGWLPW